MPNSPAQLLLDLGPKPEPSLGNFVDGQNLELLDALRHFDQLPAKQRFMHLWGAPGSGRSHLLRALATQQRGRYIDAASDPEQLDFEPAVTVYAVDDVDRFDVQRAQALFHLINQCRQHVGHAVVTAASAAPAQLRLREDLRTRLGWGLVFCVERLDERDTEAALVAHAKERGIELSDELTRYLMTHFERDLRFLTHLIDRLDRFALAAHRQLTVPLLLSFLKSSEGDDDGA